MHLQEHTDVMLPGTQCIRPFPFRGCALLFLLCFVFLMPHRGWSHQPSTFADLAKRAESAKNADQLDEAVSLYRRALVLNPKWGEGWWSLGTIEYDRNNYAAAASDFKKLVPLAPQDGTARVMLGLCEFELHQDEAALKDLRRGRALGVANDPQLQQVVFYHEGVLLLRSGQFKLAQESFGSLCQLNIQSTQVMEGMGMAVLRMPPASLPSAGSSDLAIVQRVGNAACLSASKKFDEAGQQYRQLLTDVPDFPNLHYAYGLSLLEASNVPKAVDQFKEAIKQNPNNVEARLEIAAALYKVDSRAALPYAQDAAELKPQQPFTHYLLGLLLLDTNQPQKAIPELETAAKAFPREKRVFFALGSAYARAGRGRDAAKARATFEQLNQESQAETTTTY